MARLYNLARMTTATTGTGTISLGSAVSGFLSFAAAGIADGETVTYAIKDGTGSEIGRGTYTASVTTLTRSVLRSTNSDTPISLSGSAQVFITAAAEDFEPRVNAQTGTSYTVASSDFGNTITLSNASAIAVTLPQATGAFASGWHATLVNVGSSTVTITPTTSLIAGASTFTLNRNQGCTLVSNGTNWVVLPMTGIRGALSTVASAATTDIGSTASDRISITGTTTITSFGTVPNVVRFVTFSGALTLTYNATSLILPGAASLTTAAGDAAVLSSDSSGNWRCLAYTPASGTALKYTRRNRIINGAMMISQENGSNAGTSDGYYPVDQFLYSKSHDGTVSVAQVAAATPGGSPNRLRATVTATDTSIAAGQYAVIAQRIEGTAVADFLFGGASAKAAVLRFGLKAPAGTYCVSITNSASARSYVAEVVVAAGEANTDTVKTVALPGDTSGTWLTDTGVGLTVRWCLAAGSTYQGATGWSAGNFLATSNQVNFLGTNSQVFELFDVGLYRDVNAAATAPLWELEPHEAELRRCQRYYEKSCNAATVPAVNANATYTSGMCVVTQIVAAAALQRWDHPFKVPKATAGTVTIYNPSAANNSLRNSTRGNDCSVVVYVSEVKFTLDTTMSAGSAAGDVLWYHWSANARL